MNQIDKVTLPPVYSCGALSTEKVQALVKIQEELADAWKKRQVFRTEVEMAVSVLNDGKFPTKAGKYWQCVREQTVMLDQLAILGFEYRRNNVKIRRLEQAIAEAESPFDLEEAQIDLDECLFRKASMEQAANDRAREILAWSDYKKQLDDGTFNTEDINATQLDTLYKSLINRRNSLTPGSSQAEVTNVLGPLKTAERIINDRAN